MRIKLEFKQFCKSSEGINCIVTLVFEGVDYYDSGVEIIYA